MRKKKMKYLREVRFNYQTEDLFLLLLAMHKAAPK